jgi:hypothetical protein
MYPDSYTFAQDLADGMAQHKRDVRNTYERMRYHRQRWIAQRTYIETHYPPFNEPIYTNAQRHHVAYARNYERLQSLRSSAS